MKTLLLLVVTSTLFLVAGCELEKGTTEKAGEKLDAAMDKIKK